MVRAVPALPTARHLPFHASGYDLKKLCGKAMVCMRDHSHRYEPTPDGLRSMTVLWVLRDKVVKPLLPLPASSAVATHHRAALRWINTNEHCSLLQRHMGDLFQELGIRLARSGERK